MCPCSVPTVPQYSAPRAWVRARGPAAPVGREVDDDPYIYALVGMWGVRLSTRAQNLLWSNLSFCFLSKNGESLAKHAGPWSLRAR